MPPSRRRPEVPGAEELSTKICDLLKEEKDFYEEEKTLASEDKPLYFEI